MAVSFKGGIKIRGKKSIKSLEAKPLLPCDRHVFILNDYIGAEIFPRVEEGAHVNAGDKLADAEEYTALPVHSSISGEVEKIEYNENGQAVSIAVINDKLYTVTDKIIKDINYDKLTQRERLWIIRDAGIIDMDNIPAHLKLAPEKEIKYLVINGVETDPNIGAKCRRIVENTDEVMRGIEIARELTDAKKCVIGVESSMGECINKLKPFVRYNETTNILALQSRFPQENKQLLIKSLTGISVNIGETEYDRGVVCLDIETVYNIGRVFKDGMPVIERIVTVNGDAVRQNDNFLAPIGVSAEFLFRSAGDFKKEPKLIVSGGVFNGKQIGLDKAFVTRTTSVFLARSNVKQYEEENCIHCGKCAKICPVQLLPYRLYEYAKKGNLERMIKYHVKDCIECGLCTYICPSRIDVLSGIAKPLHKNTETAGDFDE